MPDNQELAALRRFHALFQRGGKWAGTVGAKIKAEEQGSNIWRVWREAADARKVRDDA